MSVNFSELSVQITLTISEMRTLVELINIAGEVIEAETGSPRPEVVDDVSGLYFELMRNIQDGGYLGEFAPDQ